MAKWGLLALPVVLEGASVAWAAMAGGFGPPLGAVACGVITVLAPRSGVGRAAFAAGVRGLALHLDGSLGEARRQADLTSCSWP
jgi:hypothetical protein